MEGSYKTALELLRENKNKFDLVISYVDMQPWMVSSSLSSLILFQAYLFFIVPTENFYL
ncbi:unnamed protein product [Arabidopsis halleri]